MLDQNIIQPSSVVLVNTKGGIFLFCVEYRKLNSVTKEDAHPLPRMDELIDALQGFKYFSILNFSTRVLSNFRAHNLGVKALMCKFASNQVIFLGCIVSSQGIHTAPAKIQAVSLIPEPLNVEHVQSF